MPHLTVKGRVIPNVKLKVSDKSAKQVLLLTSNTETSWTEIPGVNIRIM